MADEGVAFGPCAPPFCSFVVQTYAVIILARDHKGAGDYPNAVKLYQAWSEKLEREHEKGAMSDLLERLEQLQKRESLQYSLDPPIGLEN